MSCVLERRPNLGDEVSLTMPRQGTENLHNTSEVLQAPF